MKLNIINPRSKRKKTPKKRTGKKKTMAKRKKRAKRKSSTAKRRRSPARSRTTARKVTRRRRRRRNPSSVTDFKGAIKTVIPAGATLLLSGLAVGLVEKFMPSEGGATYTSPTFGRKWSLQQYAGLAAMYVGSFYTKKLVGQKNTDTAQTVMLALAAGKVIFTEVLPRIGSPYARMFGDVDGQVEYDPDGQAWISQGGQWQAMQGAIVEASPLDGAIVEASPLDGAIVEASPLDGLNWGTEDYGRGETDVVNAYRKAYGDY